MSNRREFLCIASTAFVAGATPTYARGTPRLQYIASAAAPKAIGPYSQAVKAGNVLYASGQIALDPATGTLVTGDFSAQARRVFENLKAVLHEAGTDFRNVVKATVYLTDVANFQAMNSIYAEFFGDSKPARSTVGVAQLPRGAALEVDLIAVI
jgi:2-iminobutanoate/2-iminopropanoate deaminase